MIEDSTIEKLGIIVLDELHLMGEQGRGFIVELLLAKIRFINNSQDRFKIQIVGMSACIPNLEDIGNWLDDAVTFKSDFRPVPLTQYLVSRHAVLDRNNNIVRKLVPFATTNNVVKVGIDRDGLLSLCEESMFEGHGVLVFCATKDACSQLAVC